MNIKYMILLFMTATGASCWSAGYNASELGEALTRALQHGNEAEATQILKEIKENAAHRYAYGTNDYISSVLNATTGSISALGSGFTPLMMASYFGMSGIVVQLIAMGANVRQTSRTGKTALALAAMKNRNDLVIQQLTEAGADINAELKNAIDKYDQSTSSRNVIVRLMNNGATTYNLSGEDREKLMSMGLNVDAEIGG